MVGVLMEMEGDMCRNSEACMVVKQIREEP